MKTAIFRCCVTSAGLEQFETSANAVLEKMGIEFVDIKEFNCCGYPLRNVDSRAFLMSSARNLALAQREGVDILTFCNCCYGNLKLAAHTLANNEHAKKEARTVLRKDGLDLNGGVRVRHFLEMLYVDIGLDEIRKRITRTYKGLKVAAHYGCHLLRPRKIVGLSERSSPIMFDALIDATGAESVYWDNKYECCGSALCGINDELSMDLAQSKIRSAQESGAECLCVTCPFCQAQFDRNQKDLIDSRRSMQPMPSLLFAQLLGLCLGIEESKLGISANAIPINAMDYLQA